MTFLSKLDLKAGISRNWPSNLSEESNKNPRLCPTLTNGGLGLLVEGSENTLAIFLKCFHFLTSITLVLPKFSLNQLLLIQELIPCKLHQLRMSIYLSLLGLLLAAAPRVFRYLPKWSRVDTEEERGLPGSLQDLLGEDLWRGGAVPLPQSSRSHDE